MPAFVTLVDALQNPDSATSVRVDLRKEELTADLARLSRLEALEIVIGPGRVLASLGELRGLRFLALVGRPLLDFPEAIALLGNLEVLHLHCEVNGLPDSLARLGSLRELDIAGALNKGTMLSRYDDVSILKPLPSVLARLPALERLNVNRCGVFSLEPLAGKSTLRALSAAWSAVTDEDVARVPNLEELNLESGAVESLHALARLPLRRLGVARTRIRDASPIESMQNLEALDIRGCDDIVDLGPVLRHPALKTLTADDAFAKRFAERGTAPAPLDPEALRALLASDELEEVERGIHALRDFVEAQSMPEGNAIIVVCPPDPPAEEDGPPARLPLLEAAFTRWASRLSSAALADIVETTLRSARLTFAITIDAARAVAERKDAGAESRVGQAFMRVAKSAERIRDFSGGTMETLVDEVLPTLDAPALAELLTATTDDQLTTDGLAALFVPAFARASGDTLSTLAARLDGYLEETAESLPSPERRALLQAIVAGSAAARERYAARLATEDAQEVIAQDLKSGYSARIDPCFLAARERFTPALSSAFAAAVESGRASFDAQAAFLGFLFEPSAELEHLLPRVIVSMATSDLRRASDAVRSLAPDHRKALVGALRTAVTFMTEKAEAIETPLRELADELEGTDALSGRAAQLRVLLVSGPRDPARSIRLLEAFGGMLTLKSYDGDRIASWVARLAEETRSRGEALRAVVRVSLLLLRKVEFSPEEKQRVLAQAVGCASVAGDGPAQEELEALAPERLTLDRLAFNLACSAARRGRKESVLRYARTAVKLGKSRKQFLADGDFAAYVADPDFLAAIEGGA